MPLNHKPGEAQVDFGYALVKVSGIYLVNVAVSPSFLRHQILWLRHRFEIITTIDKNTQCDISTYAN
jgi:hypothetical protein